MALVLDRKPLQSFDLYLEGEADPIASVLVVRIQGAHVFLAVTARSDVEIIRPDAVTQFRRQPREEV